MRYNGSSSVNGTAPNSSRIARTTSRVPRFMHRSSFPSFSGRLIELLDGFGGSARGTSVFDAATVTLGPA
jgi:hypothetical protein